MGVINLKDLAIKVEEIPILPDRINKIIGIIENHDSDIKDLEDEILKDQSITSKILKLANSIYYGYAKRICTMGVEACKSGKTVTFYTAASLGNKLIELQDEYQLSKFIDKLRKIDLLIIDELGYVELSKITTQLMFQIFSERYEKGSIIITTNLNFEEWPKVSYDERMTTAIIDRLIHNSQIVPFDGDSYRLKDSLSNKKEISPV